MIQLKVLTGQRAGETLHLARFPVVIGRAPGTCVQLEERGVWDRHLELRRDPAAAFSVSVMSSAAATLNGQTVTSSVLRNGDILELGSVRLQFWLGETRQRRSRMREALTWCGLGLILAAELALLLRL